MGRTRNPREEKSSGDLTQCLRKAGRHVLCALHAGTADHDEGVSLHRRVLLAMGAIGQASACQVSHHGAKPEDLVLIRRKHRLRQTATTVAHPACSSAS